MILATAMCVAIGLTAPAAALEINLAIPFADGCAWPQTPFLSFASAQSENLLFASGERIDIVCQTGLRSVGLRWTLHRNRINKPFRGGQAKALPANRFRISVDTTGLIPGFYDLRVELDSGMAANTTNGWEHRPVTGMCVFGWKADQMAIAESRPADFKAFWDEAKAKLAKIALDPQLSPMQAFGPQEINAYNQSSACLPPDFDPAGHRAERVESCKVSFAGPDGGRVYGWLAKPEGPGPFPAMLVLPGAGFAARPRPLEHARHGYVAMDIQIHGQEADLKEYPRIPGYDNNAVFEPTSAYYFYNVHLRCLQAVNYLLSRPDVDPKRLVVVGGSQGGRLSIVVAGLDKRVAAAVPAIAHWCNQPHQRWVKQVNGRGGDGMDLVGAPPVGDDAASRCYAYYDPMNFARDIGCPVLFNAGLIDHESPPYGVFGAFNVIPGDTKTLLALDGLGHDWCPEFDRRAYRWLERVLKR
jgi:cephalosporin-C deacetylase-like acetyl esterase